MRRRTSDGFTEYYDGKDDKKRLWERALNMLDDTVGDEEGGAGEWVDKYVKMDAAFSRWKCIAQIKKAIRRILTSKKQDEKN